jgi:hypothetical protein
MNWYGCPSRPIRYNWPHYVSTVRLFQRYEREAVAKLAVASTPQECADGRKAVDYFRLPAIQVTCEFMSDVLAYGFHTVPVTYEA